MINDLQLNINWFNLTMTFRAKKERKEKKKKKANFKLSNNVSSEN